MRKRNALVFMCAIIFLYLFCVNSTNISQKAANAPNLFTELNKAFHEKILYPVMLRTDSERVTATAICFNGKELAVLENEQLAKQAVNELTFYISSFLDGTLLSAVPNGALTYRTSLYPKAILSDYASALALLKGTPSDSGYYIIKKEDTKESISKTFGITEKALVLLNPGSAFNEGEKLLISIPTPTLPLKLTIRKNGTRTQPIEYKYEYDPSLSAGDRRIETYGQAGVYNYTQLVTYDNFTETSRTTESESVKTEPKPQIIKVGSMPPISSGNFISPVSGGEITSPFGPRERDNHQGIDIGLDFGAPLHASDGGIVVTSGVVEGYGNTVIIDHQNGFTTLYAHCETLLVKENQTVIKGEQIATAGSTGISTGPHLHFEILKDSVPQNPELYITFQ